MKYIEELKLKLRTAIESSSENAEAAQRAQKLYYDRKSRARKLSVGDKVHLMQPSSTSKMLAQRAVVEEKHRSYEHERLFGVRPTARPQ